MQLFYTGAYAPNSVQPSPNKSLGGFISQTPIANGSLNNIFPTISKAQVNQLYSDVRLIVVKNTTASPIEGVRIWTLRGTYSSYKIGAVLPATTPCGDLQFEAIPNPTTLPYQTILESHEGEANALTISNVIQVNEVIGIWIQRELDTSAFTEIDGLANASKLSCDELAVLLQNQDQTLYDNSQLIIDWV